MRYCRHAKQPQLKLESDVCPKWVGCKGHGDTRMTQAQSMVILVQLHGFSIRTVDSTIARLPKGLKSEFLSACVRESVAVSLEPCWLYLAPWGNKSDAYINSSKEALSCLKQHIVDDLYSTSGVSHCRKKYA